MLRIVREVLWDRPSGWLNTRWFPAVVLLLIAGAMGAAPLLSKDAEAWGYDYKAFRTAAEMTVSGRLAEAYDPATFEAALPVSSNDMYWMYAPHGSMLLAPLAFGPWAMGRAMLLVAAAAAAYLAGRTAGGGHREGALMMLGALPVLGALVLGQAAPIFGALLVLSLWHAPTRPVAAGLMLAVLTAKPQYGLMVPVFLIAHGQWRTAGIAAAGTGGLVAVSLALFGHEPWAALMANADGPARSFIYDNLYASMPSLYQYMSIWGAPPAAANAVQLGAVPAGMALVWLTRGLPRRRHAALTMLVTCAVMPYLWFYDWLPVMAAVLILMRPEERGAAPPALLLAVWLAPLASAAQNALAGQSWAATVAVNAFEAASIWGLIGVLAWPALAQAPAFRAARKFASASSVSVGTKPSI